MAFLRVVRTLAEVHGTQRKMRWLVTTLTGLLYDRLSLESRHVRTRIFNGGIRGHLITRPTSIRGSQRDVANSGTVLTRLLAQAFSMLQLQDGDSGLSIGGLR